MSGQDCDSPLESIYKAEDEAALEVEYDKWSDSYDADTAAGGYRLPYLAAGFAARHIRDTDAAILDAGAGTGLSGEALFVLGYRNISGIDLSQKMLDRAAGLGVYRRLERMQLGGRLAFGDNTFTGVFSTGMFTEGHAPPSSFDELIRITAPGGSIIFTVRDDIYQDRGFREAQAVHVESNRWKLIEMTDPVKAYTVGEPHIRAHIFVYQVL